MRKQEKIGYGLVGAAMLLVVLGCGWLLRILLVTVLVLVLCMVLCISQQQDAVLLPLGLLLLPAPPPLLLARH